MPSLATKRIHRFFANALLLVLLVVVILVALLWLVDDDATTPLQKRVAPSPAFAQTVRAAKEWDEDSSAMDEPQRRLQNAQRVTQALVRIRGGAELRSFADDLAAFEATCAAVEEQLAEAGDARARQALRERLTMSLAELSEHDVRHESNHAERRVALENAYQRVQSLIAAGELHRDAPPTPAPAVQPGKRMPRP